MLRIATVIAIVAISASTQGEGVLPVARGHGTFGHPENHTMEELTSLNGSGGDRSSDGLTSMTNSGCAFYASPNAPLHPVIAVVIVGSSAQGKGVLSVARGHGTFGGSEEEFISLGGPDGSLDERPVGECTPSGASGEILLDCRCQGGEEPVGGVSGRRLLSYVCAPSCGRRVLGQAGGIRALGGSVGSCPASPLGPTECLSGKCFLSPTPGCPAGTKGFSFLKFGPVCMYPK
ncbi:hypothetical protein FOL46_006801 [Perkinsus olseni]|uniref:Secreted protein n=1 Tax=Perkinsus olseni TaxID=32597 RepID=A0A7J6LHU4_PEROL|nr:hypothetical protein FOL46_006801 [Perkinsus olseni]